MNCGNPCGCKGAFCAKCLSGILDNSKTCPSCSFETSSQPIKYSIVEDLIADEEVYCIYATDSSPACEWHGQLKDLQAHLDTDCLCFPVPCTNEGCSEAIPRHHLPTHLTIECGYRLTQCEYCLVNVQVREYEAHEGECSKFILTCGDCGGTYLREDTAAHDARCPDKLVTCPFACHGCDVPVLRKDAQRHQANEGANHAVLVAQRLSLVEDKLSATEAKLSELVDDTTDLIDQRVSEARTQVTESTASLVDQHSSILLKRINALDSKLSSACTAGPTKVFSWTVKDAKSLLSGRHRAVERSAFFPEAKDAEYKLLALYNERRKVIVLEVSWSRPRDDGLILMGSVHFNDDVSNTFILTPDSTSWYSNNDSLFTFIKLSTFAKYISEDADIITIKFNLTLQREEIILGGLIHT